MPIITFENIVGDADAEEVPDGYRDFIWKNFTAVDDEVYKNTGINNVIHSGEAAVYNGFAKPAGFKSPDRDDDFDFNSGFFAAAFINDLTVKVVGFNDGERVAKKVFAVTMSQEFVTFGPRFDDIDEVRITATGIFATDDLFIDF
jgi:hypothetical protein